jgi:hypothetical protein
VSVDDIIVHAPVNAVQMSHFGPSEVRATSGQHLGGHYFRLLCRHVCRKISAHVDGGTSGPSSVRRRVARTPIGASGNLFLVLLLLAAVPKPQ